MSFYDSRYYRSSIQQQNQDTANTPTPRSNQGIQQTKGLSKRYRLADEILEVFTTYLRNHLPPTGDEELMSLINTIYGSLLNRDIPLDIKTILKKYIQNNIEEK